MTGRCGKNSAPCTYSTCKNMYAKDTCMCVMITSWHVSFCSVYCIYTGSHTQARCALPLPLHRAGDRADGTGLVSVCGTEVWWGRSLTKLPGTYPGPFFYPSPYKTPRQHWLPIHSAFRWSRTDRFQLHSARREPAVALTLRHPQKQHLSYSMSP